jgi:hypothetical protein
VVQARRLWCALAVVTSGLFSALGSHAVFSALQSAHLFGSEYLHHAHGAVPLATCGMLAAACTVALFYATQVIGGGSRKHVIELARTFGGGSATLPLAAIALVAVVSLGLMELLEGSLSGLVGAFGSVPPIGIALVAGIAILVGLALRSFARWIAAVTESLVAAVLVFVRRQAAQAALYEALQPDVVCLMRGADVRHIGGNRAPPPPLAFAP